MTTGDLDALRVELVRDIVATDDLDVLKTVKRTFTRALAKAKESVVREEQVEYITKQEILDGIREGLTEYYRAKKAGIKQKTLEEVLDEL